MYLERLEIEHLKLIDRLELNFTRDGKPRLWTVLLGENGQCKTSILQAIAMAASGYVRASQMANIPSLPDRRRQPADTSTRIAADFSFSPWFHHERIYPGFKSQPASPPKIHSWLEIPAGHSTPHGGSHYIGAEGEVALDPVAEARARNLNLWFMAGYGTSRVLPRPLSSERSDDPALGRVLPLFDRGRLIGTGFADLLDSPQDYALLLREALVDSGLLPYVGTVELRGRGGVKSAADLVEGQRFGMTLGGRTVKIPATWLSQGYQSSVAWIADLIGQIILEAEAPIPLAEMEGLVLIDEIDLHLHPSWQVRLVPILKKVFPRLQFVVTTHSPMILPGLQADELIMLGFDEDGNVVANGPQETPALMTGTQLYQTYFGLDQLYPHELGRALNRYGFLAANPVRNDAEEQEMHALLSQLAAAGADPGWEPVPRDGAL